MRALGVLRPGVEMVLLAAVALGCAQGGWAILTPNTAGASAAAPPVPDTLSATADESQIRSPFAPAAALDDAASFAANSMIGSVRLAGVRMADDPSRSAAMLTMSDGVQRPYYIGQDIGSGVRLEDVQADYVLLSFEGGQRQVSMERLSSYSFANALMGRAQAPAESAPVALASLEQSDAASAQPASSEMQLNENLSWLVSALARPESVDGVARGWRVSEGVPNAAATAGLRPGDLIVSVNGVGPGDASALLGAVADGQVELAVQRGASERLTISFSAARPT